MQSQKLGLYCIQLLNKNLLDGMPGTGYLFNKGKEIPKVPDVSISEQLQYACRFWMDHILATGHPSQAVNDAVEAFLKNKNPFLKMLPLIDVEPLVPQQQCYHTPNLRDVFTSFGTGHHPRHTFAYL